MEAARKWSNIRRTIQMKMGNSITVDGRVVPIYHDYRWADPDAMRDSGTGEQPAWIETRFVSQLAGHKGSALMQVDLYSRIGPEGSATADPFGLFIEDMADQALEPFSGVTNTGCQKGVFIVNDYTDPANPTQTQMRLLMQSSAGNIGEPQEKTRLDFQEDFRRVTMSLRFRTIQDAAGAVAFYTD